MIRFIISNLLRFVKSETDIDSIRHPLSIGGEDDDEARLNSITAYPRSANQQAPTMKLTPRLTGERAAMQLRAKQHGNNKLDQIIAFSYPNFVLSVVSFIHSFFPSCPPLRFLLRLCGFSRVLISTGGTRWVKTTRRKNCLFILTKRTNEKLLKNSLYFFIFKCSDKTWEKLFFKKLQASKVEGDENGPFFYLIQYWNIFLWGIFLFCYSK